MKVRIKTWHAMEREFGLDSDGAINCPQTFCQGMEDELPKDRIIFVDNDDEWNGWQISEEMIAEYLDKTMTPGEISPFTEDADTRKTYPVFSGAIAYFPKALAQISHISWAGNEQHHPGTPLHWDKSKSADEPDALMRHIIDYTLTGDMNELYKVGWRALAWIEREMSK